MNKTSIAWCDYSSNPLRATATETGRRGHYCTRVDEACLHCYASDFNENRFGTGLEYSARNAAKVTLRLDEKELREWLKPAYAGSRIFVADMTDWMLEGYSDNQRDQLLAYAALAGDRQFLLLTKRHEKLLEYMSDPELEDRVYQTAWEIQPGGVGSRNKPRTHPFDWLWPLPNVWIGVTAGTESWVDLRAPVLQLVPAAVRFLSLEPLLGPVDLQAALWYPPTYDPSPGIHWIIVGGESGPAPRPFDPEWARDVRDQSKAYGFAFFMKQLGGKRRPNDKLTELPEDLRVREFPGWQDVKADILARRMVGIAPA